MNMSNHVKPSFLRNEDGSLIILGLFFFVAILMVASMAVDLARYEQQRIQLQGIADRAVLAAANMRFDGDGAMSPEDHVRGYFQAAGYSEAQVEQLQIEIVPVDGGRQVTVLPRATLSTFLMSWVGVDSLDMATPARAEVATPSPLEVVMVLDISWSMTEMTGNGQTRIENLRQAAVAMVNDLMDGRDEGDVAITIVPYETWVVPPPGLMAHMETVDGNATDQFGNPTYCMEFADWDALRASQGDGGNGAVNALRSGLAAPVERRFCGPLYGHRVVRPFLTQSAAAVAAIEALQPLGSTSIDLGLRYGAMFFDDGIRPFIQAEIDAGRISPSMTNRPAGVDNDNVLRVMVLMTDGENCCGVRFTPAEQDENALAVCDNLRDEGVTVFSIAFEAPQNGVAMMEECASSGSHFFNTNGEGLSGAFQAIGRQINAMSLRLTL